MVLFDVELCRAVRCCAESVCRVCGLKLELQVLLPVGCC